jgi:hypothetical protein
LIDWFIKIAVIDIAGADKSKAALICCNLGFPRSSYFNLSKISFKFNTRLANGEPVAGVAAAAIAAGFAALIPAAIPSNVFKVLLVIPTTLIAVSKDEPIIFN